MTDNKMNHHPEEGSNYIVIPVEHKSRWRQVHRSWIFWIFLFLMLTAIMYYIVTVGFLFAPQK